MITPEPRRCGARLAPGRRPSLGGVGVVPENIESIQLPGAPVKNLNQAGSHESPVKIAGWILPCFGQVR
jgi:hypothetical protein